MVATLCRLTGDLDRAEEALADAADAAAEAYEAALALGPNEVDSRYLERRLQELRARAGEAEPHYDASSRQGSKGDT